MDTKQKNGPRSKTALPAKTGAKTGASRTTVRKPAPARNAKPASDRARREAAARAARIKAMKQEVDSKPKRRVSRPSRPMQPVIYTQPKIFNRNRLFIQLAGVFAVVMALIMGLSVFFRVETITVSGANAYSAWAIREASGIQEGDYLMTFSKARACAKIKAELPYVDTVRVGIKLPDTVNIVIEEIDVVYSVQDQNGAWWLITSEGLVMEQTDAAGAGDYTKVIGVKLSDPEPEKQATAYQELISAQQPEDETLPEGETTVPTPLVVTEQQKLSAALEVLQALEANEIVGEAASVDVTDLTRIELWYGTRYQVNLGDTNNMDYKIACLKGAVGKLSDYDSGELDISFTIWPDQVTYTPFD